MKPVKFICVIIILIISTVLTGCSQTVYERKKDETNPSDQGLETKVKLEGPRAVMETKF